MSMVSVVMATYNGAEYVAEQVYSILNQTYRDFEIIIVDDCSQDATVEIIKKIFSERGFLNYRLVVNNNNMGVTKSFEKGVIESKGKYIAISDQDDIWFKEKLYKCVDALEKNNANIAYSPSLILNGYNKTSSVYPRTGNFKKLFAILMHNNARGATILIEKDFVVGCIPFSSHDLYDKWIYFLGLLYGRIIHIDDPLQYYRIHKNNFIGDKYRYRSKENLIKKIISTICFYEELYAHVCCNKNVNPWFSQNEVLSEINKIINFKKDTLTCINERNILKCIFKYFQNIVGREFNIQEKIVYFYYFLLKLK